MKNSTASETAEITITSSFVRQFTILAVVGLLLLGPIGGGSIVAAQQADSNATNGTNATTGMNGTTAPTATGGAAAAAGANASNASPSDPVNATIQDFKKRNLGYSNLSASKKKKVRGILEDLAQRDDLSRTEISINAGKINRILALPTDKNGTRQIPSKIIKENFNSEQKDKYPSVGPDIKIPDVVEQKMNAMGDSFKESAAESLGSVYGLAFTTPVPENDGWHGIFGQPTNASAKNGTNAPGGGDANATGENNTNATVAGGGFAEFFGISPANTYHSLYNQLLVNKFYPVMNYVLGIGVIVLGLTLTVKPLMSRFRALDLMTKFITFLFLYVFSWGVSTLMHGIVNDIVVWLQPTQAEFQALVGNLDAIGAGAAAAYFVGSGGIFTTIFVMGLELAARQFALLYFFPYVFPALLLLLYISPWSRLKRYASMGIWQYVNILTMAIPMAALLKAAVTVESSVTDGIGGILVLISLFGFALAIPLVQTYFFIQVPGKAGRAVTSAASGAARRIGGRAKVRMWGSDGSSSDSTATANTSPGERTEEAVTAGVASQKSSPPTSGQLSDSQLDSIESPESQETTASRVRALDEAQHSEPNNANARYKAYTTHPRRHYHAP